MSNLKPRIPRWVHTAWTVLRSKPELVSLGWEKCLLLQAWDGAFQHEAQLRHAEGELFQGSIKQGLGVVPSGRDDQSDYNATGG